MIEGNQMITTAESAANEKPDNAELQVNLGMAYFHAQRLDEAMAAFQRAIALKPDMATAYNGIGRVRYHTGPAEAAIAAYEQAIALDLHYIDPVYGLGIVYAVQLGNYAQAIAAFQRSLVHNPGNTLLAASLGSTYARMGRIDEALAVLQAVIAQEPTNTFALSWLSILYFHLKRYDDVITACQQEIAQEDAHSPHRLLGLIYDARGQTTVAMAQLEQAITLEREDYEARAALAKIYYRIGRQREADEQLALANTMAQEDDGEYGLACVAAVSGNFAQALALLEIALATGQVQPGWVRIDPELAFLNDDPRFRVLIGDEVTSDNNKGPTLEKV